MFKAQVSGPCLSKQTFLRMKLFYSLQPNMIATSLMWLKVKVKVAQSSRTLWDPKDYRIHVILHNLGPLALLPFPSPGNLPNPRIEPWSPALQVDSLPSEPKLYKIKGFPGSTSGKESACQCRRHKYLGFDLWSDPGDWKDPLEKEVATHSSILAWEIPRTEEPGRLQSMGSQKSWTPLSTTAAIE